MDIQGITTTQILTVGIFLVGLIFLQIFITKNKSKFSSKWGGNKRIHIVEEKALSTTEKIRIISIDNSEFLLISNKGKKSSFLKIDSDLKIYKKRESSNSNLNKGPKLEERFKLGMPKPKISENPKEHELSKAIKIAREMNPNVSYK